MIIKTWDKKKQKHVVAGKVEGGAYHRKVIDSKHLMRKFDAYAIQEDVIEQLQDLNIGDIIITSQDNVYFSTSSDWLQPNIRVMDFGHGKQRFLPRRYMIKKEK